MSVMIDANCRRFQMPNGMIVYGLGANDTRNVYEDIFEDACYLRHGVTLHDGDCIIDVGANTGLFTLWLNTQLTRASVYCLEPIPDIHRVLRGNLAAHDHLGAKAFNAGLSDRDEEVVGTYYPHFSNASTLFPDASGRMAEEGREYVLSQVSTLPWPLPWLVARLPRWIKNPIAEAVRRYHMTRRRVACRVRTLSGFLSEQQIDRVDLLKIDAERSESRILAGVKEADWVRIRQLVVEVHDGETATRETVSQLEGHGFQTAVGPNPALPGLSLVYAVRP